MDTVQLPLLPIETSLEEALIVIKNARTGAVVSRENTKYWLFKKGAVLVGMYNKRGSLANLGRIWAVHEIVVSAPPFQGVNLGELHNAPQLMGDFLDQVGASYAVSPALPSATNMVTVITRHEAYASEFTSGPRDCYCTYPPLSDNPHAFNQPLGSYTCPFDGSTIICS